MPFAQPGLRDEGAFTLGRSAASRWLGPDLLEVGHGDSDADTDLAGEEVTDPLLRGAVEDMAGGLCAEFAGETVQPFVGGVPEERVHRSVAGDGERRPRGDDCGVAGDDTVRFTGEPDGELALEHLEERVSRGGDEGTGRTGGQSDAVQRVFASGVGVARHRRQVPIAQVEALAFSGREHIGGGFAGQFIPDRCGGLDAFPVEFLRQITVFLERATGCLDRGRTRPVLLMQAVSPWSSPTHRRRASRRSPDRT